jgi:hypothetical protein
MALSPAAVAARNAVSTPYYGLVYLGLASLAYTDEKKACEGQVVKDLTEAVAGLPPLPAVAGSDAPTVPGKWQLTWGPCYTADYSNLMYAATYNDEVSGEPIFAAVSIRGTDTSAGLNGLLKQILEDTDSLVMVKWDAAVTGKCGLIDLDFFHARIAQGSCVGLHNLTGLANSAGESVLGYLKGLLAPDPQIPIVVTGHSLGGCQATVMAAYLAANLPGASIAPNPFAPNTAGNNVFALNEFDTIFPGANVWWNTLDLVPQAYATIGDINSLWSHYQWPDGSAGPGLSQPLQKIVNDLALFLKLGMYHYTQPTRGNRTLNGSLPSPQTIQQFLKASGSNTPWNSWEAQLLWQHFPPNYHQLISTQFDAKTVAPYPLPDTPTCGEGPSVSPSGGQSVPAA